MLTMIVGIGLLALTCGFVVTGSLLAARYVIQLVQYSTEKQSQITVQSIEGITVMLKDAVIQTVASTTQGVMVSLVGSADTPVQQRTVPPDEDANNPEWTKWEDGNPDAEFADIGDSVFFNRPANGTSRVASMEEGEAIIPGVPLPDMSGEAWQDR